jgi:hypothetical protein
MTFRRAYASSTSASFEWQSRVLYHQHSPLHLAISHTLPIFSSSDSKNIMSEIEKQPLIENQPEPTLLDLRSRWTEARANLQAAAQDLFTARREYERAWSRTTRGRITIAAFTIFIITVCILPFTGLVILGLMDDEEPYEYLPRRVPLEAHIMSKCPDARDCLHDLVLPAMVNVSNLVDFKLSYIGK